MKTKTCSKCKKEKPVKEFYVRKASKDALQPQCKECIKEYGKERYKENTEEFKEQKKRYYNTNKEKFKQKALKWKAANPEKYKESGRKSQAKYKAKVSQIFDIKNNNSLSSLASGVIKGIIKVSPRLERATGKPTREFRKRIFSQLEPGMNRENYGKVWEIDHKIPKAILPYGSFDDPNFKKLWCLENLRPMWETDNRKKGKKRIAKRKKNKN